MKSGKHPQKHINRLATIGSPLGALGAAISKIEGVDQTQTETIIHMESKRCIKCLVEMPKTKDFFFYRNKTKGWFSSWCKSCKAKHRATAWSKELNKQRERRSNSPAVAAEKKQLKGCLGCGTQNKENKKRYCVACFGTIRVDRIKKRKRKDKCLYKSKLRKATPPWADKAKIRKIYDSKPDGCHVDHIIPLRGDKVSGLHVEYNLQYLAAKDNMKKSNRYDFKRKDGNHYSFGE